MFDNLTNRLGNIFSSLKKRGFLNENDINIALREIRIALLEADVSLSVVKQFIDEIKEKAGGQEIIKSITPGQMIVKIVHDHLVKLLGSDVQPINLSAPAPIVLMMVGLQGSGKTTTTAKIAYRLKNFNKKKILIASLDVYRPAAQEQLKILGEQNSINNLQIVENEKPEQIAIRAYKTAKLEGYDVVILDTAGRLHIDDELMNELYRIQKAVTPVEILLVADAMMGQDAVAIAKAFKEKINLTGIILTRIEGDSRGGAALAMRSVTNCSIKYVGVGEHIKNLEEFDPERIAGRILGKGDIVTLVEKASEISTKEEEEELAKKLQKNQFDFNDMAAQLKKVSKMGGIKTIMNLIPGISKLKNKLPMMKFDDKIVGQDLAIISSMTKKERKVPKIINGSRKKRIANGTGVEIMRVNRLIKQFKNMQLMLKRMNKLGKKGLQRHGIESLFNFK